MPFWESKTLSQMSDAEWEKLCDGCGKCCMVLLEDEDSGRLYETDVACRLFDIKRRRCTDYARRARRVKDCVRLSPDNIGALDWMPKTCAYRRLHRGEGLADWHPLISGTKKSVEKAGIAVVEAVSERTIKGDAIWDHVTGKRRRQSATGNRRPEGGSTPRSRS